VFKISGRDFSIVWASLTKRAAGTVRPGQPAGEQLPSLGAVGGRPRFVTAISAPGYEHEAKRFGPVFDYATGTSSDRAFDHLPHPSCADVSPHAAPEVLVLCPNMLTA
jgi:hypothetical protein